MSVKRGSRMKRNVQVRREEALVRDAEWRGLTPAQQLAALDKRLGVGVGAVKQRAKLTALLKQAA